MSTVLFSHIFLP